MKKIKKILISLLSMSAFSLVPVALISCSSQQKIDNNSNQNNDNSSTVIQKNIDAKSINFNSKTYDDAKLLINSEFVFNNLSKFVISGYELISSKDDIAVEIVNNENQTKNSITFTLTIKGSKWLKDNDIQSQDFVETITINGLYIQTPIDQLPDKSEVEQTNGDLKDDGGNLSNSQLHASKYKIVIQYLNLNSNDLIFTYTNELLNQKLHQEPKFANLTLKILDGSSSSKGLLKLQLTGTYNQKSINSNIDVSNFYSFKNNEFFSVTSAEINLNNWFDNNLPITQQELNITSTDLIQKYLSQLQIKDSNNNFYNIETIKKYFSKLNINSKIVNGKLNLSISDDSKFNNMKFSNNSWVFENELSISNSSISDSKIIDLPTINDLKMIMVNNLSINSEYLSNFYPSYFLGTEKILKESSLEFSDNNIITNKDVVINKYKNSYFKENELFFVLSNVIANDETGNLSFNIFVKSATDNDDLILVGKDYSYENLKSLNNIWNNEQTLNVNIVDNSSLFNKIKNFLNQNRDEINKIQEGNFSNISSKTSFSNDYYLYLDDWESVESHYQNMIKNIKPSIYNNEIKILEETSINSLKKGEIGTRSNLYKYSDNEQDMFVIKNINYLFTKDLKITKQSNGFDVELYGTTQIGFANNVEKEYATTFYMKILNFNKSI